MILRRGSRSGKLVSLATFIAGRNRRKRTMPGMSLNDQLAELFARFAAIMEIRGEPVFKSIAFTRVARTLKDLSTDLRTLVEADRLSELPGAGASSRKIIEEFVRTGRSGDYDQVAASIPAGLIDLLAIPSLGPKTISLFWKQRGITSIGDLKRALADGSLAGLKGIGEKKLQGIRDGIELLEKSAGRIGIWQALTLAEALVAQVRKLPGVQHAEYAGSLRRRRETIGDIDIIAEVAADQGAAVAELFCKLPQVDRVLGSGDTKASVFVGDPGVQVDLRLIPRQSYGAALLYFTGSKEHNVVLRQRAIDMGLKLNEWGLYRGDEALAGTDERDVYAALKLPCIEPELREDRGEISAALAGQLPTLIAQADIRGDLHTHTTASDGAHSIEQMALAAKARGYAYLAITDHSRSQVVANGLTQERMRQHIRAIRQAADRVKGIVLLAGAEVDILADGHLDYDDALLDELDIVVASPHTALRQATEKATDRMLRAIDNRYVHIIGHPTGRLIGQRDGLPLEFERVFAAAASAGVALEINSGCPRLDLSDVHARAAVAAGCRLSINTDAHAVEQLEGIAFGIHVARRAWVEPTDVINCLGLDELRSFLGSRR